MSCSVFEKPRCPCCEGRSLRRSRRRLFELVLSRIGFYPYRCRDCGERSLHLSREHATLSFVSTLSVRRS